MNGLVTRARALLQSPAAPLALAILALLLSLPSLGIGLQLDDHTYLRLFSEGRGPLELLHESSLALTLEKQLGVFAWWISPEFSLHFIRPLTALTHWIEFTHWPQAVWAMHLSNCLLYAALVAVAATIYRAVLPTSAVAGVAALMFTVDDSHAQSVGWIASRHTIFGTLFALLALLLHVRSRARPSSRLRFASVACTLLTLLTAEFGVAALAYLLAYAIVFEAGSIPARLRTVWPHALLSAAWLVTYVAVGGGVRGASWYRDPASAPLDTLLQGLADVPLWLLAQLGGDVANLALVLPQTLARVLAALLLWPVLALLIPALRGSKSAQFCALGMLLSLLPLFGTIPQDRLLLAASFGGFGWIACLLAGITEQSSAFVRAGAPAFNIPHLIIAPLAFIPLMGGLSALDATSQALAKAMPAQGTTQAIVVNLPVELLTNAAWSVRPAKTVPMHQLYAGFSKLTVERHDANSLDITAEDSWGSRPLERMFTARSGMPTLHAVRDVQHMRATVTALDAHGLPSRVHFEFPDALETAGRAWLVWKDTRPAAWTPPAIGEHVELAAPSMLGLLF